MNRNMIDLALDVAAKAHLGQLRKGTDVPYVAHSCAVGIILTRAGCAEEVVAAGILHDTVEDTSLTLADIERDFGETVAELVAGSSEPDKSRSWEERKRRTLRSLRGAPRDVCMVVCADKLHNVRSIVAERAVIGDEVWDRFERGEKLQKWYYSSLVDSLGHHRTPLFRELEEAVKLLLDS